MGKWKIYIMVLGILFGLCACSASPTPAPNDPHPKVLRYAMNQDLRTLDPQEMDSTDEATIAYHIYEGLMRSYQDQLGFGMAKSYEISTDGLTYTFHLRDATYSDGVPVRAQDFVYAVERMITDDASSRPFAAYPIKNAAKIHKKELPKEWLGVSAIDDKTLQFELESPTPYFLQLLTLPPFSPIRSQNGLSDANAPSCNGPFWVKSRKQNESILLEKNPYYWDADRIKLDQVQISISSDRDKLLDMFLNNELDFFPVSIDSIPTELEPYAHVYFNGANDFIRLNMDGNCPLRNKNLRLALNYALNRNAYIADLKAKDLKASTRYILPILPGARKTFGEEYPLEAFPLNGDTQRARSYLESALKELHLKQPKDIQLKLLVTDDYWSTMQAQVIQQQLQDTLGIQIQIFPVPYNTHMDLDAAHKFQMSLSGWIPEYADPATYLELWRSDSSYNYASYYSLEYDECFQMANRQTDPQSRMSLLARAENILLQDGALIPLQIRKNALIKNPKLINFQTYYINAEYQYIYADLA